MAQHPMNFQDSGAMASLAAANSELAKARNATPVEMLPMFRAVIQRHGVWFEWYWQLR
jgi:hypothetical protein